TCVLFVAGHIFVLFFFSSRRRHTRCYRDWSSDVCFRSFPLSVRAWLALCSDGAYRNFVRSRSLIAQSRAELAGQTPAGEIEVLSLGAGQGDKDVLLLEALRGHGRSVRYVPVDASQGLLEIA